jgi:Ras-related protein Rab-8A
MASEKDFDLLVRLLLVGDLWCGKSSLQRRFVDDEYTPTHITSVSLELKTKRINIDGKRVRVDTWQVQGQEMAFRMDTPTDYSSADGVLVVYDVTDENSFLSIEKWMKMIDKHAKSSIKRILVGAKIDLTGDRVIDANRIQPIAEKYGLEFFECSAKENQNVTETFTAIIRKIINDGGGQPAVQFADRAAEERKCW